MKQSHLVGVGLKNLLPPTLLSPLHFLVGELVSVSLQKRGTHRLASLFKQPAQAPLCYFFWVQGCEAQWLEPWALESTLQ